MIDLSFFKGKRVFLTGHTGFKGTWLSSVLRLAGAEVTGYALEPSTSPSLFEQTGIERNMHSVIGDVRDYAKLTDAIAQSKPEVVFHLAAQPLVRLSYKKPIETYETNVMGTVHILEALRNTSTIRSFVNVTTDKVYENREWLWGYRENENLNGFDPYSNSKSCSELVTASYRNSFFQSENAPAISTARSGNVIGGGDYSEDRIIPDCIRAARAGKEIVIRNPHSTRPYQHVLECLSGYLLLAQRQYEDVSFAGAYNFGPNEESCVTTGDLVSLFVNYWKGTSWRVQGDGGPHEANFLKLDCSKAKHILNWAPRWDIRTAIDKTIDFARLDADSDRRICLERQIREYFML